MCDKRLKVLPSADLHSLPYSEDSIDLRCFEAYLMERVMSYRNILGQKASFCEIYLPLKLLGEKFLVIDCSYSTRFSSTKL